MMRSINQLIEFCQLHENISRRMMADIEGGKYNVSDKSEALERLNCDISHYQEIQDRLNDLWLMELRQSMGGAIDS
jgi:hypothetical protein